MATLDELKTRRDALIGRVTALTSRVTFGDRTVQYDLTQAKTALELIDREIAQAQADAGLTRPVRAVRVTVGSGY